MDSFFFWHTSLGFKLNFFVSIFFFPSGGGPGMKRFFYGGVVGVYGLTPKI